MELNRRIGVAVIPDPFGLPSSFEIVCWNIYKHSYGNEEFSLVEKKTIFIFNPAQNVGW